MRQRFVADVLVGPHGRQEFLAADELRGAADQDEQQVEGQRGQRDRVAGAGDEARRDIDDEVADAVALHGSLPAGDGPRLHRFFSLPSGSGIRIFAHYPPGQKRQRPCGRPHMEVRYEGPMGRVRHRDRRGASHGMQRPGAGVSVRSDDDSPHDGRCLDRPDTGHPGRRAHGRDLPGSSAVVPRTEPDARDNLGRRRDSQPPGADAPRQPALLRRLQPGDRCASLRRHRHVHGRQR